MIVHLRQFEVSSKSGRRIHLHTLQAKPAEARRGEMAKPRVITFPLFSSFSLWSLSKSAPDISIQCWSGSSGKLLIRKTAGGGYRRCQHYASLTCFFLVNTKQKTRMMMMMMPMPIMMMLVARGWAGRVLFPSNSDQRQVRGQCTAVIVIIMMIGMTMMIITTPSIFNWYYWFNAP